MQRESFGPTSLLRKTLVRKSSVLRH